MANAVPVIPNEALLRGTVVEYCVTSSSLSGMSPEQVFYRVLISVEEAGDVKGYPNFLRGKEGQVLAFYSKEKQPVELFGKRIRAFVEYKGDERGGHFWLKQIEIME